MDRRPSKQRTVGNAARATIAKLKARAVLHFMDPSVRNIPERHVRTLKPTGVPVTNQLIGG